MKIQRIPMIAAVVAFLVHLIANPHYGFFRDELYFIICGQHPALGYVDQPSVVPLLAAGSQLFGHSLVLLRAVPAIFAGASVYVAALLAIEFGGGMFAQVLAMTVVFFCPVLMAFGTKVGPDEVGLWLWPLAALYIVRIVRGGDPRWWMAAGAAIGISIESKYSVVFFAVALVVGLALTPERRVFASKWFAAGAGVMLALALPNFLWQAVHGFPMWELLRAGQNGKNIIVSPLMFLVQQIIITNLFFCVVWIAGLVALFMRKETRFLSYAYVLLIALMIALGAKHYYPADVYPILLAAGAVVVEGWTKRFTLARPVVIAVAVAFGIVFVPLVMPVLSEPQFMAYSDTLSSVLHISPKTIATEHHRKSLLSDDWSDMHGWPQMAAHIASIYYALPPAERAQAVVFTGNYGEASAIEFFEPGVPVISGHNQYWLWGDRGFSGNVVIDVQGNCGGDSNPHLFKSVQQLPPFANDRYAISYERDMPIDICRGISKPLSSFWSTLRHYE